MATPLHKTKVNLKIIIIIIETGDDGYVFGLNGDDGFMEVCLNSSGCRLKYTAFYLFKKKNRFEINRSKCKKQNLNCIGHRVSLRPQSIY